VVKFQTFFLHFQFCSNVDVTEILNEILTIVISDRMPHGDQHVRFRLKKQNLKTEFLPNRKQVASSLGRHDVILFRKLTALYSEGNTTTKIYFVREGEGVGVGAGVGLGGTIFYC